jgi:hypothetical protein
VEKAEDTYGAGGVVAKSWQGQRGGHELKLSGARVQVAGCRL